MFLALFLTVIYNLIVVERTQENLSRIYNILLYKDYSTTNDTHNVYPRHGYRNYCVIQNGEGLTLLYKEVTSLLIFYKLRRLVCVSKSVYPICVTAFDNEC